MLTSDEIDLLESCVEIAETEVSDVSPEARNIIQKLRDANCPDGLHELQTLINDRNFCPGCGKPLRRPTPHALDSTRICPDCKVVEVAGVIHHKRGCVTVIPHR